MTLMIGTEVELVVKKRRTPIVCDFLPYTKKQPLQAESKTLIHKDASMIELAMPPVTSGAELDRVYEVAKEEAQALLPDGCSLHEETSASYSDEELDKDPYASEMGCSKSWNIYGSEPAPPEYFSGRRYAGMHLNISGTDVPLDGRFVFCLDIAAGLVARTSLSTAQMSQVQSRQRYYGRPGEHRIKDFGLEYRALTAYDKSQLSGDQIFQMVRNAEEIYPDVREVYGERDNIYAAVSGRYAPSTCREILSLIQGKLGVSLCL